ncbi:MAG TPA: hypothetical protein VK939_16755 [Longimicrobiales bacterium]|nr:hypothetical protein [Longimicrobiales bacterium]
MNRSHRWALAASLALAVSMPGCARDADDEVDLSADADTLAEAVRDEFRVTDVELGRAMQGDSAISDATDDFRANDTIHALVRHEGRATGTRITARWTFEDGQIVDERTETVTARGTGREYTHFMITKPDGWPAGKYTLHVLVNDREVETEEFEVGT